MDAKRFFLIIGISLTLPLTACGSLPSGSASDAETVTDSAYVTVGSHLTVHNTDSRLTLLDKKDTLAADGLYYASWTTGNSKKYENSDGETVDLYDAQLYLLLGESKTSEAAAESMENWLTAGKDNYEVSAEETVVCNGQSYTLLSYRFANEDNPYSQGVSAFGVFENCAVCAELTCQETYNEDLKKMLTAFLEGCNYGT